MRYYLDTEFDGFGGSLLSLALVPEDPAFGEFYLARPMGEGCRFGPGRPCTTWVEENVVPVISVDGARPSTPPLSDWPAAIEVYLRATYAGSIEVIADWPDDIAYFSKLLITGPGEMIKIPGITLQVSRVDAYPTDLPGAVQHNALWDARALRRKLAGV